MILLNLHGVTGVATVHGIVTNERFKNQLVVNNFLNLADLTIFSLTSAQSGHGSCEQGRCLFADTILETVDVKICPASNRSLGR